MNEIIHELMNYSANEFLTFVILFMIVISLVISFSIEFVKFIFRAKK